MPGVKRERDGSVGVLTLDEPETLNAMTPDLLGDLAAAIGEIDADPQGEGAGADRRRPRLLLGPEPQGRENPRRRHRRRRHEVLLAGVQGDARVPRADRGGGQWRGGRRRLQPRDGRRHDRCGAFGPLHPGVQPHRAGSRSRFDLAAAAPRRPAARARTDDDQRAAHGRAGEGVGTGPRSLRRCVPSRWRARSGAQARQRADARPGRDAPPDRRKRTRQLRRISSAARSKRRRKSGSAPTQWRGATPSSRNVRRCSPDAERVAT